MRYSWMIHAENQPYGPFTAPQLKEMAANGRVRWWDLVEVNGCRCMARQVEGLLPPLALIEVVWQGLWMMMDVSVSVTLNGHPMHQGSFVSGFRHPIEVPPGRYQVGFKIPIRGQQTAVVDVMHPGVYSVEAEYSRFWGNFTSNFRIGYTPPYEQQISAWWREEQTARV